MPDSPDDAQTSAEASSQGESDDLSDESWRIAPFPIIYYTPETSAAIGGGAVLTYRDIDQDQQDRPDSLGINLIYTLKNQSLISLAPDFYLWDQKCELLVKTAYINMPTSFFGIGNRADFDKDDFDAREEEYSVEAFRLNPWIKYKVLDDLRVGVNYDYSRFHLTDVDRGGLIDRKEVRGTDGGTQSGLGPVLDWDTRDNTFYPTSGEWYKAWATFYTESFGSDYDYERYSIDLRQYYSLKPDHVLAFQGLYSSVYGEVPFTELVFPPLRGIYQGYFVDQNMLMVQAEYRFPISGRWSGAVFAGVGDAIDSVRSLSFSELKYSTGGGIRFAIDEQEDINLRFDLGVSPWGVQAYIMIEEAF